MCPINQKDVNEKSVSYPLPSQLVPPLKSTCITGFSCILLRYILCGTSKCVYILFSSPFFTQMIASSIHYSVPCFFSLKYFWDHSITYILKEFLPFFGCVIYGVWMSLFYPVPLMVDFYVVSNILLLQTLLQWLLLYEDVSSTWEIFA